LPISEPGLTTDSLNLGENLAEPSRFREMSR
jgi:hypothetical protein